jgi:hypothetical protein
MKGGKEYTMKRRSLLLLVALSVLTSAIQTVWAQNAHGNHDAYIFLAGATPIVEGPDVATAPNGSTVTLSGTGSFKAGPDKTASGGGTYTIKDPAGDIVAAGPWTAVAVLSFVDYGADPSDPTLHGGEAHLRVSLSGIGEGVLIVECLISSPPPAGKDEGIRLVLGRGLNFNKSTSGQTLFIKP